MKIAIITNLYGKYARGGAERIAEGIAGALSSKGHQVAVITTCPYNKEQGLGEEVEIESGKLIYRFYPLNIFWYRDDFRHNALIRFFWHLIDTFNLESVLMVQKILKKEKPDIVLTHNLKGIGFLIPPLLRHLKIKHIHTVHDVQLVNPRGLIIKGKEKKWLDNSFFVSWYAALSKKLFASPAAVISPSNWLLRFYEKCGFFENSKKIVIPNPVSLMNRQIKKDKTDIFTFTYLGQLEEHKGILWLIQVFKKIKNSNVKLWIVGGGAAARQAQQSAAGDRRVHFAGPVDHREIYKVFEQTDLTAVPSLCYENSPGVIYESLSFGVPVIASKIGGVAELIKEGKNGFTFKTGDEEVLLRLLDYCIEHREEIKKMSRAARESVRQYTIDKYIEKLERFF